MFDQRAAARTTSGRSTSAHDVSALKGKTAGIDPRSGRVWFAESIPDVALQLEAEGIDTPLFFVWVGYDYYYRKRGRRCRTAPKAVS